MIDFEWPVGPLPLPPCHDLSGEDASMICVFTSLNSASRCWTIRCSQQLDQLMSLVYWRRLNDITINCGYGYATSRRRSNLTSTRLYYKDSGSSVTVEMGGWDSDRRRVFRQICIRKVGDACPGRGVEVPRGSPPPAAVIPPRDHFETRNAHQFKEERDLER